MRRPQRQSRPLALPREYRPLAAAIRRRAAELSCSTVQSRTVAGKAAEQRSDFAGDHMVERSEQLAELARVVLGLVGSQGQRARDLDDAGAMKGAKHADGSRRARNDGCALRSVSVGHEVLLSAAAAACHVLERAMNPSTRAVRDNLDEAMARLDAQLLSSANVIDGLAAVLANTTSCKAIARRLATEADRMRDAALR
jgi:hypothetical protein